MKKINNLLFIGLFLVGACTRPEESGQKASGEESMKTETKADLTIPKSITAQSAATAEVAEPTGPLAAFEFVEESHDFGDIKQGDVVKHAFRFKNTGEVPLIISDTKTSCGCTTPEYPKDQPIAPGEESSMTVQFNSSGKIGVQNKTVTIYANVAGGSDAITIKANILQNIEGPLKKHAN